MRIRQILAAVAAVLILSGSAVIVQRHLEYKRMHTIPAGLRAFKLTDPPPDCGKWKDHMPGSRDPAVYARYIKARRFWRTQIEYKFKRDELQEIFNDVQWAADKGDWGAIALLSQFYFEGLGHLDTNLVVEKDGDKHVALSRRAIAAGQAWGYYNLGVAHQYGYGGAAQDDAISWAYLLKAAELGSPDAQMALADAYLSARYFDQERAMRMCAFRQGHGAAAQALGRKADVEKKFDEAIHFYQEGVKFGDAFSASVLMLIFSPQYWGNHNREDEARLRQFQIYPDPDRSKRYKELANALEIDPDLRLGQLDQVLPLPPSELPKWRGIEAALTPESLGPPTY